MICDDLPRANLAVLPTPLDPMPRLTAALGGPALYCKRDDRSGLSIGGSKARIFDVSMGHVVAEGYNAVVASAGVQSNKLREVAAAAARLGLKAVLVLTGSRGDEEIQGNRLLFDLLGAEVRHFENDDPFAPELMATLEGIRDELAAAGHRPYVIHRTLLSGTLGAAAYVDAGEELHLQLQQLPCYPRELYAVLGAGIMLGGLVLGLKHLQSPLRVIGVSVVDDAATVLPEVLGYARKAADLLRLDTAVTATDFDIIDHHRGKGRGGITPAVIDAIRLVGRSEGILLDPIYTGKAMAGMLEALRAGRLGRDDGAVFLHSGGLPAVFAYADLLAGA